MELAPLASDVHALLKSLDPAVLGTATPAELAARVESVTARLHAHLEGWNTLAEPFRGDARAQEATRGLAGVLGADRAPTREWLDRARRDATPHYEALAHALRAHGVRADSLHPTNHARTFFHVMSGVLVVIGCHTVLDSERALLVSGVAGASFWFLETMRRFFPAWQRVLWKIGSAVTRAHEYYRPTSSTWFTTGLFIIALTTFDVCGMLGILVLAVADPAAAIVGRRFGRTRLMRNRTLEGSLAFVVAGTLVGLGYVAMVGDPAMGGIRWALPVAAALGGAVAEAISTRLDDNLTVSVVAAWTAKALLLLASA